MTGVIRSCLFLTLAASCIAAELTKPVVIPASLHQGRIILSARIGATGPHRLLVDTGSALTTLRPEIVDSLNLTRSGRVRIIGISGEERAPTYSGVALDLGSVSYTPRRIASLPSEREEPRRGRDGVLGSGFFRAYVVEIDARGKQLTLHPVENFQYTGKGKIIPLRFEADTPIIEGALITAEGNSVSGEFEVDTGCDSGICIGKPFIDQHKLLQELSTEPSEKVGVGGSTPTRDGRIPLLHLGELQIKEPQTDFFAEGSPVDEPLAGHIGMGVLGNHKVIFDYSRKRMIIE